MSRYSSSYYSSDSGSGLGWIVLGVAIFVIIVIATWKPTKGNANIENTTNNLLPTTRENVYYDTYECICYYLTSETHGYQGYGYGMVYYCGSNDKPYHYDPIKQKFYTLEDNNTSTVNKITQEVKSNGP